MTDDEFRYDLLEVCNVMHRFPLDECDAEWCVAIDMHDWLGRWLSGWREDPPVDDFGRAALALAGAAWHEFDEHLQKLGREWAVSDAKLRAVRAVTP
jgi:hypothetical protein